MTKLIAAVALTFGTGHGRTGGSGCRPRNRSGFGLERLGSALHRAVHGAAAPEVNQTVRLMRLRSADSTRAE